MNSGTRASERRRGSTLLALGVVLLGGGCAGSSKLRSAERTPPPRSREATVVVGVDHTVERGQTLWRIAAVYGVPVDELARANRMTDPTVLPEGRVLFIPGALVLRQVPPYPAPLPTASSSAGLREDPAQTGPWIWPVDEGSFVSGFGAPRRDHEHAGVDIRGRGGQPIRAARSGRVVYSGATLRGYGKTVIIDHGAGLTTLYAHNAELLVREGQSVAQAQEIARLGRSGNATTDHCHFEIRRDEKPLDPLSILGPLPGGAR